MRLTRELIAAEAPLALIGTVGTTNLEALAKSGVLVAQKTSMVGVAAGIEFVRQYAAAGGRGICYGMSIIDIEALMKALGPERSRGYAFSVVLPLAHQTSLPVVREYLQLRQASNDANLSARSIEGYIAAKALVNVLETTNTLTPADVTAALSSARGIDVGGFRLDFSADDRPGSTFVDFAMFGSGGRIIQ